MNITIAPTISLLEIVWTIISTFGIYYNGGRARRSRSDKKFLRENKLNKERMVIAHRRLRNEAFRMIVHISFVVAGLVAMTTMQPRETSIQRTIIQLIFVGAALSFIWLSWREDKDDQKILEYEAHATEEQLRAAIKGGRRRGDRR